MLTGSILVNRSRGPRGETLICFCQYHAATVTGIGRSKFHPLSGNLQAQTRPPGRYIWVRTKYVDVAKDLVGR